MHTDAFRLLFSCESYDSCDSFGQNGVLKIVIFQANINSYFKKKLYVNGNMI